MRDCFLHFAQSTDAGSTPPERIVKLRCPQWQARCPPGGTAYGRLARFGVRVAGGAAAGVAVICAARGR
jgi:hypothetical protein